MRAQTSRAALHISEKHLCTAPSLWGKAAPHKTGPERNLIGKTAGAERWEYGRHTVTVSRPNHASCVNLRCLAKKSAFKLSVDFVKMTAIDTNEGMDQIHLSTRVLIATKTMGFGFFSSELNTLAPDFSSGATV